MARRLGIFRRNSDSEGGEGAESPSPPPASGGSDLTPEDAAKDPRRTGRFMAWLGYGPEAEPEPAEPGTEVQAEGGDDPRPSMPATQEWQVGEAEETVSEDPPPELPEPAA